MAATIAISCWTAHAASYAAWVSTRLLLGLLGSPIEVVPEIIVNDLYFNHQRGRHIGIYMLMLTGGNYLCAVFSGLINDPMGRQWVMYWCAILNAIGLVVLFFGFEETMYYRNTGFEAARADHVNAASISISNIEEKYTPLSSSPASVKKPASEVHPTVAVVHAPPRTYIQKLALFRTIPEKPNQFVSQMYQPLVNFWTFPVVLRAAIFHGIAVVCFNALNATASVILSAPPYSFKSSYVGLAYIGPTIGALLGAYWSGEVNDKICLYLARRNKDRMREAEHGLYAAVALCIVPPVGFIVWGVGASQGVHWIGLVFGMGMLGFALTDGGGVMLNYVVDSYKELSGTTLSSLNVMRCTMAFGFSYAVTPWWTATGTQNTFITWSLMSFALFGTFVPMIIWGKKLRIRSTKAYWVQVEKSLELGI